VSGDRAFTAPPHPEKPRKGIIREMTRNRLAFFATISSLFLAAVAWADDRPRFDAVSLRCNRITLRWVYEEVSAVEHTLPGACRF